MRRTSRFLFLALGILTPLSQASCNGQLIILDSGPLADAGVPVGASPIEGGADQNQADGGNDAGSGGCTSNLRCTTENLDQPSRCNHDTGKCAPLITEGCPFVIANPSPAASYTDDNAIFVGGILDIIDGQTDPALTPSASVASVVLAFSELQAAGGLPGNTPSAPRRPVVAVLCQRATARASQSISPLLPQVENHLVNEVGVNAVIAHLGDTDLLNFHSAYATKNLFIFNPGYGDAALSADAASANGRYWTAIGDVRDLVAIYAPLVGQLEARIKTATGLATISVANVSAAYPAYPTRAAAIADVIRFNGNTPAANGPRYFSPPPYDGTDPLALTRLADAIVAAKSNIIIFSGRDEVTQTIIPYIEYHWDASTPRPYYILPSELAPANEVTNSLSTMLATQAPGATLERRVLGVAVESPPDPAPLRAYAERVAASFPALSGYNGAFNNFYDTAYATIFAAYAAPAGQADPSGEDFAAGMLNIVRGTPPISIGPDALTASFNSISLLTGTVVGPGGVQFVGTMGPWTANLSTFTRVTRGSVYCMRRLGGNQYQYAPDVYRYNGTTQQLVSPLVDACYPGYPF